MNKIPPIKELKKICSKRKETYWRDKFNRSITIRFTKLFLHMGLTATPVTVLSLIVGLIAVLFFAIGSYPAVLLAILFHHFAHVLDGVDGEIARFNPKKAKKSGAFLDLLVYFILSPLLMIGMGIGAFFYGPDFLPSWIFLVAGFAAAYFLFLGGLLGPLRYEYIVSRGWINPSKMVGPKRQISEAETQLRFLVNPSEIFNFVFIFGILNLIWLLVLFYAVFYIYLFARKLSKLLKGLDKL